MAGWCCERCCQMGRVKTVNETEEGALHRSLNQSCNPCFCMCKGRRTGRVLKADVLARICNSFETNEGTERSRRLNVDGTTASTQGSSFDGWTASETATETLNKEHFENEGRHHFFEMNKEQKEDIEISSTVL